MPQPSGRFDEQTVFRSLFTAYPDGLLLVDASGEIVLANPSAAELLGYPPDELVGLSVDELVPDAIRPRHAAYRSAFSRAPRSRPMGTQMDLVARRRDGSEVMVEIALSPLQGAGLPYVVAAVRGIGAYPRVAQALKRARYGEQLVDFGSLAVDSRDPQRLLDAAPRVACEALDVPHAMVYLLEADQQRFSVASGVGLQPAQPLGAQVPNHAGTLPGFLVASGLDIVVSDRDHAAGFPVIEAYREAGLTGAMAVPLSDRGRPIGVLCVRAPSDARFGDEETRFLRSLGSLLATGLQRSRSDEALNHAQRLESVGQLTGGIAHDFNNLLTVISGNLQVLGEAGAVAQDEALQQMVEAAAKASRRAAELTEKLLTFSRRQVLQPAVLDVGRLVRSLAGMLRRTLDQRILIEVDEMAEGLSCVADATQLESALLNIAINARDAMPEGGTLRFAAQAVDRLPDKPGVPGAGLVAIAVSDTGAGMPEGVMQRAFEPFFTTKETGRGTGLGLSTVYGFATQSRGTVTLSSVVGQGTTVTLYLPQPQQAQGLAAGERPHASVPAGLRVLLVEDEAEVRAVARHVLADLGCMVTTCATAEDALVLLSIAGAQPRPFDLLLTDVALGPGLRGTTLAGQAAQRWPQMKALLTSGYSEETLGDRLAWPLLRKPYTRKSLAQAIVRALA